MSLSVAQFRRCQETLDASVRYLNESAPRSVEYEIYRSSVVKHFELSMELACKLLKKVLRKYHASPNAINALSYKEVFREAVKYELLSPEWVKRWFAYRKNRNETTHEYGEDLADETLSLLPQFLEDVTTLLHVLENALEE